MKTFFADIILPLAVPKAFTYRLPQAMNDALMVGMRAIVPFGKHKLMTGIVRQIHENPPQGYTAKYVDDILDEFPMVNQYQLSLWRWITEYYMCHPGEVLLAALPAGLRLSSESNFVLNPSFDGDLTQFTEQESKLLEILAQREVAKTDEVSKILGVKRIQPLVKKMLEAGAIMILEGIKERYTPKIESFVSIAAEYSSPDAINGAFELLRRAPKQEAILLAFLHLSKGVADVSIRLKKSAVAKFADANSSQINELAKKGILTITEEEVGRLKPFNGKIENRSQLSETQTTGFDGILEAFKTKKVVLLHGVTSSGKTEIYIELIHRQLEMGKQVLFMLPEIALTTQMIERMQRYFGEKVIVYHSRFNQNERVEIWQKVLQAGPKEGQLVIGARSSLFLPYSKLGLVIVDEEHENSYKQMEPAPRYHGRDTAIVLSGIHKAKTLLGSATPAFESMQNAKEGKFGYIQLTERFGGMALPEIIAASLSQKQGTKGYFTERLLADMTAALENKEQIILFQNRRGYSPVLLCQICGWSPECTRCDVTTTYHKNKQRLICHYCGSRYSIPHTCHACGSNKLTMAGFGTERIEEEVAIQFPEATVSRLDVDTTRTKYGYQQIISDFQDGNIDILIGTQMVTKGLDFGRVSLVGILNADLLLKFPDFRATERGFQLMTQVAGRAGRRQKRGKVIIQTHDPEQWVVKKVIEGAYSEVFNVELAERKNFGYPPFSRLVLMTFRHRQLELLDYCVAQYFEGLKEFVPATYILGPEYPPVARIKNQFNKNIMLKIPPKMSLTGLKDNLNQYHDKFFSDKQFRAVRLIINIDPQ